ncbi:MAG: N-acetylmuramoyl-L-alanine amidase [Bacillaceae bacterium]|nr:N-acetylmuramoyl-L-alanine amidase [Bacillaceae bacterium]
MKHEVKLVFIDDGHGMNTPGKRSPYISELKRRIKENEFNSGVAKRLRDKLSRHDIQVYMTAPGDEDVPLRKRTDFANEVYREFQKKHGKDRVRAIFVSIHYNAFDGTFKEPNPSGISIYVYPGHLTREAGRLAEVLGKHLRKHTRQQWRGIKEDNFHVLRETLMPAVLTENGFMDHPEEARSMADEQFQEEVASELYSGICEYFGLSCEEKSAKSKVLYRVITGSYRDLENAERRVEDLKKAGFDSFIDVYEGKE